MSTGREFRAIVIDVAKREIREETFIVFHAPLDGKRVYKDTLTFLQNVVGGYIEAAVNMGEIGTEYDSVYVNEEGLLDAEIGNAGFFAWEGAHQPFAGSGVIMGVDAEGDTVSAKISVEDVKKKVKFLTIFDVHAELGLPPPHPTAPLR